MNPNDVVMDINAMLNGAEPPITVHCCIYMVPFLLRQLKPDAYTPKVLSIGPFHHSTDPHFQTMEKLKIIYCEAYLQLHKPNLETLITYVEQIEPDFRRCYSETLKPTKEELIKLIFVDSCFIFELFLRYYYDEWPVDDAFLLKPWLFSNIMLDLLLLENQLPFFVLENLFNLSFSGRQNPSFLELSFKYFADYNTAELDPSNISIRHFTDLIRIFHLQHPFGRRPSRLYQPVKHILSATQLLEAGVKFEVNAKSKSVCLLDLEFSGRVLKIPQLRVADRTEILFRNMVALEQCHYPKESYIIDYVAVLDFLINTAGDVDILVKKGVLVNWMGDSKSVANLFNALLKNITHLNFNSDYSTICQKLNDFCEDPRRMLIADLKRDYCNTAWKKAASGAGVLLLFLSLIQSVCSVVQVLQQA